MKNKLKILVIVLLIFCLSATAKSKSGIYLTLNDYKNGKLSYESECKHGLQIRFHNFF